MPKIKSKCKYCKKIFYDYLSNYRKYCSRRCYYLDFTQEHRKNARLARLGKPRPGNPKNWKHTKATKKKLSKAHRGKRLSLKTRLKISRAHRGEKSSLWRGGKSRQCQYKHITDMKWKIWRNKVFKRDNWICQICGARSGVREPVYLEPHHIKGWTKYPKLRYEVSNGITLCKECHKLLHKKLFQK